MNTFELPPAIEPDYWNVVFLPSRSRLERILLGRFRHVSAFTYIPGFRAWLIFDVQWGGMRLVLFSHEMAKDIFIELTRDCEIVRFARQHKPKMFAGRLGFYCVSAIKCLLGLSCVALLPDGLYRHLVEHGGVILGQSVSTPAAAAGSGVAGGTATGPGEPCRLVG
jgi:hypothetical protein